MSWSKYVLLLVALAFFTHGTASAQDEMFGEIDKLESGEIEQRSDVPLDPIQSAEDIEKELNEEFGIPSQAPRVVDPAPVEVPMDELFEEDDLDQLPIVDEETQEPEDPEIQQVQEYAPMETIEPPPPIVEEDLAPVEEFFPEEEEETFVEEMPPQEAPYVEEQEPMPMDEPYVEEPLYADQVPHDFEERMHRIYSQFYTEATSDQAWSQIAGERINETYTVQRGDTLWDISGTFFGNGHYWPKVWQMNDDITNPHRISAGYVLKFVPGQINQAPQLNIAQGEGAAPATTDGTVTTPDGTVATVAQKVDPVPVIPPPEKKYPPVLKNLPPSLPYIRSPVAEGFDKDGFDIEIPTPKIENAKVYLQSYLSEEKPISVGEVIELNEDQSETATLYETVFVKLTNGGTPGEKITVYALGEEVEDTSGNNMGKPVIQQGEIQIQELVNTRRGVYKAIVLRSIAPIKTGSLVARMPLVVGSLDAQAPSNPVDAEIVGGAFDNERRYLGYQDIVYLNKGGKEGLREGQIFTVLKSVRDRKKDSLVNELKEQIAKIKVIKTTKERATAIVLESTQYVRPGDFIGVQARLPGIEMEEAEYEETDLESEFSDEDTNFEFDQPVDEFEGF